MSTNNYVHITPNDSFIYFQLRRYIKISLCVIYKFQGFNIVFCKGFQSKIIKIEKKIKGIFFVTTLIAIISKISFI